MTLISFVRFENEAVEISAFSLSLDQHVLTAGQFSVKLLFKNFPVVILCIGIILVFQNIIHGGW